MRIAVVGSGPAGSAAAALFASRGWNTVLFDDDSRPELIAGESLVPAVVPILKKLGVESAVADLGTLKPGVTFYPSPDRDFVFSFNSLPATYPRYAYNVPRPAFDCLLQSTALRAGSTLVTSRAELIPDGSRLLLSAKNLEQVPDWKGRQPDLVVDASGRRRLSARLLDISTEIGPRRDVAYFAHFNGLETSAQAGHVCINRLAHGWSWRIPLRGKTSFGLVLGRSAALRLGNTPEERIHKVLVSESAFRDISVGYERISPVISYANYQLISSDGYGENWASIGDAFGFVDPMLSPGVFLALTSADILAEELGCKPLPMAIATYSSRMKRLISAWMNLVAYFYDGRIFYLHDFGNILRRKLAFLPGGFLEEKMTSTLASMASGFSTSSHMSRGMLSCFEWLARATPKRCSQYEIL